MIFKYFLLLSLTVMTLFSSETTIENKQHKQVLQYEYHIDEKSLDLQDMIHNSIPWKTYNGHTFKLASPNNPVWFKLDMKQLKQHYAFLQIASEFLYLCDVYYVKDEKLIKHDTFGVGIPVEDRTALLPQNLLALSHNHYPTEVYVKILTMPVLSVTFNFMDSENALATLEKNTFFNALFYGVLFFLFIYNLVLYLFTQYKAYLPYLTYIFGITLYFVIIEEYYIFSLWPFLQSVYFILFEVATLITIVSMILLPMVLFKTKKLYPRLHHMLKILLFFYMVLELFLMFTQHYGYITIYNTLYEVTSVLIILMLISILFVSIDLSRQGNIIAIIYSIAWTILIAGVINYMGQHSILDSGVLSAVYYLKIAIIIEGLLFSFILVYRFKEFKERENKLEQIVIQQADMIQTDRMFMQIAHQWRSPLNTINAIIFEQIMLKEPPDKQTWEKTLHNIEDQTHYLSKTIEDFQYLHALEHGEVSFTIKDIVEESLELLSLILDDKEIEITVNIEENLSITGTKTHYIQVLLILLNNAVDVLSKKEGQKKITIEGKRKKNDVLLTIEDNGGGIEKSNLDKIFDLYFSTKKDKSNMGMGLFMAKKIMEINFNGSLEVMNGTEGACFTVGCCHA